VGLKPINVLFHYCIFQFLPVILCPMKSQRKNSLEFPRPKFQGEEKRHIISYSITQRRTSQPTQKYIHPASRGVAAHTAGLFRSVRGAKGGVEYEEQSSTGELTCITAGFVNIFLSGRSPSCGIFTFPPRASSPS